MDSSHRQVSSVDARGCRKTEGTEGRGLSDRLGVVRGYVVIRVRLTLQAESVATGTVAIRFLHRRHVKGGRGGSRGSPKEQHYLPGPSKTLPAAVQLE